VREKGNVHNDDGDEQFRLRLAPHRKLSNDNHRHEDNARCCAAAIVLIAIFAPVCCLSGSHANGAGIDAAGFLCSTRAGPV
jgi:hypothetical protein